MKSNKRTRAIFFTVLAVVVVLCVIVGIRNYQKPVGAGLSEAEIAALRETYPVCGDDAKLSPLIDKRDPTWEEIKENSDTFVYATIDGEWTKYESSYGFEQYEYPITVLEDTQGYFEYGKQMTISANIAFIEYNPDLKPGMKIIFPVNLKSEEETRLSFSVEGMYYVTDDETVLSAFDEDKHAVEPKLTGKKLWMLMEDVKK